MSVRASPLGSFIAMISKSVGRLAGAPAAGRPALARRGARSGNSVPISFFCGDIRYTGSGGPPVARIRASPESTSM